MQNSPNPAAPKHVSVYLSSSSSCNAKASVYPQRLTSINKTLPFLVHSPHPAGQHALQFGN